MCECLRGIFRVTWTPSSNADSDRELEESHVYTQAREPAVKGKRRSPPSDRPPTAPHANPHHSASPEDQESPERVVQKEKLHAELKQVLSLKRSHLKETSHLAQAEMDSLTEAQAVEETSAEVVEVVVETEAEAGASGYSVTGGGERGIFIKDVLKDSTAAKHLSLQQGDQLLSARVYFDNVKYEDALKILQCAEPYKVSFFLKRTITSTDVTMHPGATSLELKGPKTKMQKMSVKSIKPFKATKKRGGRFGLKRLKENKKGNTGAELELEGSHSKVEPIPVDVEFAFPKIKLRKDGKAEGTEQHGGVVATGRKQRMIRCPRMKAKGAGAATGEVDMTQPEGQADVSLPDVSGAKVKVKGKGHRFGIHFPKRKKTKPDTALSGGSLELKPPDVKFTPPSVEFRLPSGNKDVDLQKPEVKVKEGSKFMHREVELSLGLPSARHSDEIDSETKAKDLAEGVEGSKVLSGISAPNIDLQLDTRRRVPDEIEGPFVKGTNISMPKTDISLPKIGYSNMDIEGPEKGGKICLPTVDISLPKMTPGEANVDVEGHIGKGGEFKTPTFDVSLPKFKSSEEDMNKEVPEVKGQFNVPKVDLLRPIGKAGGEVDIEGYLGKGGTFQMPTFDISLPKMKSSEREIHVEGPEVKGGHIQMPSIDISLPKGKAEGNINIEGHSGKGSQFKMPSCDISLPKMKDDASLEESKLEGGKFEMPTLDMSLAKGKAEGEVNIDANVGKEEKFKMTTFEISLPKMRLSGTEVDVKGPQADISLPKGIDTEGNSGKIVKFQMSSSGVLLPKIKLPEGDMKIEGSDVKGSTFQCSLPTGKTEGDISVEGDASKGGKFHMPSLDISPPNVKLPEGKAKVEGPEIKGGTVEMPNIDVSLPKGKTAGEINIEGHVSKGGKFKMPKFGISFPKLKSPEGKVNIEGPEVKGGKFHMPTIDISLPKGKAEGDINVEGDSEAGGTFHMPTCDISLPKMNSPEADISLEGPEVKGGNIHMPTIDLSLTKGKREIDTEGHSGKGGKFQMPALDISLPKMKTPEGEVSLEGPEVKGGKFHMPSIDISLPKMKLPEGKFKVEGPEAKGGKIEMASIDISLPKGEMEGENDIEGRLGKKGKFHMPTFNMSLPKLKSNDGDIKLEGPEVKCSQIHMPAIDISLPKGKAESDLDVDGHDGKGGKFHMPSLDISLLKMKLPEGEVKVEGPDAKGGNIEMPSIDISLPKGKMEGENDIEGRSGKGGKFHMPSFDVSLPKIKLPEGDIKLEGPEGKGNKIHIPNIDMSLPKGKTERDIEVEGHGGKRGKFHMPSIDISLPKMKLPEGEVKVEGPEAKGRKIEMPLIDISLPKGKMEGENDIEGRSGKGGKFHMPSFDVSLPKIKPPEGDVKEGLEVKGGKLKMPQIEAEGRSGVTLPTVKLPTVDISAPKVDLDFGLSKAKGDDREEMELLKAEGGRPSSGASLDMPDVSLKMPRFSLPKFGGKSSGDVNLEGYGTEADLDIRPPQVDGEGRPASVEIGGDGKIKGQLQKPKMKMPKFGISKKDESIASPDVEIKTKKGKVDIQKPGISVENPEDKTNRKYRLKFPKFKKSCPKGKLPEGEIDASLDSGMEGKGGFHAPNVTIKMPKFSMPGSGSKEIDFDRSGPSAELDSKGKVKMPSVEISLPAAKTSEREVLLPKAEVDVSEADIRGYEGNLKIPKMPTIDVTLPKVKHETKIEGERSTFKMPNIKMPDIDLSLPKGKTGDTDASTVEIEGGGGKFKMPGIKMPKLDISLPKGNHGEIDVSKVEIEGEVGKSKMPHMEMQNVDKSLPKAKGPEMEIEGGGGKFKMPHMKMPKVDLSLPKGKYGEISAPETDMEGEGGKFKMPHMKMSNIDISLPKGKTGEIEGPEMEIEGGGGKLKMPHMKMPKVDSSLLKGKSGEISAPEMKIEGGKLKMPHMEMSNIDISLPKEKSVEIDGLEMEIEGPEMEIEGAGGKLKMPHMKMPNIGISLPIGKTGEMEIQAEGGKFKMHKTDISLPKGKSGEIRAPEMEVEEGNVKMPQMKMHKVDISLPKGKTGDFNAPEFEIEGEAGRYKMPEIKLPKIDFTMPKGKSGNIDAEIKQPNAEAEGIKQPNAEAEGIKQPNAEAEGIKQPNAEAEGIKQPNAEAEGIKQPNAEAEGKIKMSSVGLPKFTTPDLDLDMNVGKPNHGAEVHGKTGSHSERDHKTKVKMPTIDIECPKRDLELDSGFHKAEGKKDRKRIELPDLDLKVSGTKGKGPKVKGTKFKIGMPTMKNTGDQALDAATKKTVKDNEEVSGRLMIKKTKHSKGADVEADAETGGSVLPNISLPDVGFSVSKGASREGELHGPGISAKLPKFKLPNVEISGPSVTGQGGAQINSRQQENKDGIKFQMPKVTLPSVGLKSKQGSAKPTGTDASTENGFTLPNLAIKAPKIPDTDFDIRASQAEDQGADTSTRQKIKIPKFGVALPAISSPEARVHLKDHSTMSTIRQASVESEEDKIRMPKIKMKPAFVKSGSKGKSAALSIDRDLDGDDKSKGAKLKMPKVTFSPCKTGEGSSSSLNGEKDPTFQNRSKEDKAKFVKLKLPKIEFSSPYSKIGSGEEDLEMSAKLVKESSGTDRETKGKKGKMSLAGFKKKTVKGEEETQDNVVSSSARTEMLGQDSSESPTPMVSIGIVPGKSRGQARTESRKKKTEGEQSTWFKAPKFNMKPHSTGILHITPEGSPHGSRSSLQCQGVDETAGTFRIQMPSMGFSTQEMSEENVTTTKEGTVTVVTKTTKHTVTESRTGQTHTSLSQCSKEK